MRRYYFIACMGLSSVLSAFAESEVVDGVTWYYQVKQVWDADLNGYIQCASIVSGDDKYMGELSVPPKLGGVSVTDIHSWAFYGCSLLTTLVIPSGVTSIGTQAFDGCGSLLEVTLPSSLQTIGYSAFSGCSSLQSVTLPEGVASIGDSAFYGCSTLKTVVVPNGVTGIGESTFAGCSSLQSVRIPEGVTGIGKSAFAGCRSLLSVRIPNGVKSIGNGAFSGCSSLKLMMIPDSVELIGEHAFYYCSSLCSVKLPVNLRYVDSYIFRECTALVSVTIPYGVQDISYGMFYNCRTLSAIVIPSSVTRIGGFAFDGCNSLNDVVFMGVPPQGISASSLLSRPNISYTRECGAVWKDFLLGVDKFSGFVRQQPVATIISSVIRSTEPTVLDVVYQVTSSQPTVKVRALAFQDGERSFAKVVRPETFVADTNGVETAGNVGDAIVPNVPHTLSWRVSSDWSNRLAKVSFEVLATEGELLPLEVRTIPASDAYGKMDVSWNAISERQWFDALLWLYADKCEKLSVRDGVCFYDGKMTASGTTLNYNKTASNYYSRTYNSETKQYDYVRYINTPEAVLDAMGYKVLTDAVLNYVNEETRLGLNPSGFRQYGWKIVE